MARETLEQKKKRAQRIVSILHDEFPDACCPLTHETPFQLLVAVMLSAQCTDERVNMVTPALFKAAPGPREMKALGLKKIEQLIRSIGLYRNKAKGIWNTAKIILDLHGGEVPRTIEELTALPGVGRKTANVILGTAFGESAMVVDTHVTRIANRLDFASGTDPVKLELALQKIVEPAEWTAFTHLIIFHGRKTCTARVVKCEECPIALLCPSRNLPADAWKS